jgi:hypothetical protein
MRARQVRSLKIASRAQIDKNKLLAALEQLLHPFGGNGLDIFIVVARVRRHRREAPRAKDCQGDNRK